jgi:hypothetical protein
LGKAVREKRGGKAARGENGKHPRRRGAARPRATEAPGQRVPVVALEPEPGLPLEPLTPAFLLRTFEDLRVPTVALPAEILTVDGRVSSGRIFVPAAAHTHEGVMRAEEWLNDPSDFFPFLPDDASRPVLLNRHEVIIVTVPAEADAGSVAEGATLPERKVTVDCGGRRLSGTLVIDMPEEHQRVLDYLNRPGRFLTLRDRGRHHLIQKNRITRVKETREE